LQRNEKEFENGVWIIFFNYALAKEVFLRVFASF
jgi:hypothetical protein